MAPLQKSALVSLAIGLVLTAVLVLLFVAWGGIESFSENTNTRMMLSALFVVTVVAVGVFGTPLKARRGPDSEVDERDLAILRRAPQVQLVAVMLTLAGWTIGLTEYYWEQGLIPIHWSYLMMWSALIAITLARSLGVLIGYWRSGV